MEGRARETPVGVGGVMSLFLVPNDAQMEFSNNRIITPEFDVSEQTESLRENCSRVEDRLSTAVTDGTAALHHQQLPFNSNTHHIQSNQHITSNHQTEWYMTTILPLTMRTTLLSLLLLVTSLASHTAEAYVEDRPEEGPLLTPESSSSTRRTMAGGGAAGGGNDSSADADSDNVAQHKQHHYHLGESLSPTPLPDTAKLTAIFPVSHVPTERKDDWQEHLIEQLHRTGQGPEPPQHKQKDAELMDDVPTKYIVSESTSPSQKTEAHAFVDANQDAPIHAEPEVHRPTTAIGFQGDFAASNDNVLDERTLLDVFGEAAKEFLTQRVIPDTDEECRWDWRSVKCEPACECRFNGQWGDYHLGRSCRKRPTVDDMCVDVDPASIWQDTPVTRRLLSLVTQTSDILKRKVAQSWDKLAQQASQRFSNIQHKQCDDLWSIFQEQTRSNTCFPPALVPLRSLPQRILCGPIDFAVCDDESHTMERMMER